MIIWLTSQMTASDKPSFEGLGIVKKKIGRFQPYGFQWYSGDFWNEKKLLKEKDLWVRPQDLCLLMTES